MRSEARPAWRKPDSIMARESSMDNSQDKTMEAELRKAVLKAFKQLLKDIESEPTLVIESNDSEASVSEETIADIRSWLFKRR